jgi:hypothetical protein
MYGTHKKHEREIEKANSLKEHLGTLLLLLNE